MVTTEATFDYRNEHDGFARTYFRRIGDAVVSSIGLDTSAGQATDAVDEDLRQTLKRATKCGVNVLDTSISARHQRSERVIGSLIDAGVIDREAVYLSSKGGHVPFDGDRPDDPGGQIVKNYVKPGIIDHSTLVHGRHCIEPGFLANQLDQSLDNLQVNTLDCYYVHDPEVQLDANPEQHVYDQLENAFELFERRINSGDLRSYGVATTDAFRVPRQHDRYLS
ncbi:MAG: aldo/keto reductase, partial [Halobacteriaceae archaeon]